MSSGPFQSTKYEDNQGIIHPIRVQPEGAAINGTPPAGAIDSNVSAQVGGSRRSYGCHARGVRLVRTVGTAPNTFKRYNFYPVLTATAWNAIAKGATFTIDGVEWTVQDTVPEKLR